MSENKDTYPSRYRDSIYHQPRMMTKKELAVVLYGYARSDSFFRFIANAYPVLFSELKEKNLIEGKYPLSLSTVELIFKQVGPPLKEK